MDLSASDSEYDRILHPNEENNQAQGNVHTGFEKYLHRFDELIMKPLLIYKYEKSMQKKSKDFFKMFMDKGEEIE